MKKISPDSPYFEPWKVSFRDRAHRLIKIGYTLGRQRIQSDKHQETHITGFVVEAINDWMRSPNCSPWCKFYDVHEEAPAQMKGRSGKSRPRTDIFVRWIFRRERPEYIFEAKRLRKKGYGIAKYIGLDGMGCFIEGVYASRYDEAAMLGYVQSDTLMDWKDEIKGSISTKAVALNLISKQYDELVIDEFPLEWVSEHERKGHINRPIKLYHILLDCLP